MESETKLSHFWTKSLEFIWFVGSQTMFILVVLWDLRALPVVQEGGLSPPPTPPEPSRPQRLPLRARRFCTQAGDGLLKVYVWFQTSMQTGPSASARAEAHAQGIHAAPQWRVVPPLGQGKWHFPSKQLEGSWAQRRSWHTLPRDPLTRVPFRKRKQGSRLARL